MSRPIKFTNGEVTLTGEVDGKPCVIKGRVGDARLDVDEAYYPTPDISLSFKDRYVYSLTFQTQRDGTAFTYITKPEAVEVVHKARVEATDATVEALEKAREQAGAPKNARLRIFSIESATVVRPVTVEFKWTTLGEA